MTELHFNESMQKYLNECKPEKLIKFGGAGGKALKVLLGEADAFLFPHKGTKKW